MPFLRAVGIDHPLEHQPTAYPLNERTDIIALMLYTESEALYTTSQLKENISETPCRISQGWDDNKYKTPNELHRNVDCVLLVSQDPVLCAQCVNLRFVDLVLRVWLSLLETQKANYVRKQNKNITYNAT